MLVEERPVLEDILLAMQDSDKLGDTGAGH